MQVRDLIEELKRFNQDAEVELEDQTGLSTVEIAKIEKLGTRNAVLIIGEPE